MSPLELITVFVLLFEVSSGRERIDLFHRPDEDVTLPCGSPSSHRPSSCSNISWLFNRDISVTATEANNGRVREKSTRAARLSVDTDCSLVIKHITAEDVGRYTCRLNNDVLQDVNLYLNVLTIALNPADVATRRDDEVEIECFLLRYKGLGLCQSELNGFRWVDETGTVLSEGVSKINRQADCFSRLTVKRQSANNRRYTCQFVNKDNKVEVQAEYTPVFTDPRSDPDLETDTDVDPDPNPGPVPDPKAGPDPDPNPNPDPDPKAGPDPKQQLTFIIIGALAGVVLVLVIIAAVLIKYRKRDKVSEDVQKQTQQHDEPEVNLTYITVNHENQLEPPKKKPQKEEEVTYSTVKSPVKTEDDDPSSFYSNISKPK